MNFSFCQFRPKFNFENQIKENMQTKRNSHLEVDQGFKVKRNWSQHLQIEIVGNSESCHFRVNICSNSVE